MPVPGLNESIGVMPALATPLHRDGTADEAGIRRLVEHVLSGGVHGMLALGSTGETASLDEATRHKVLETVLDANAGRVPVLLGIGQTHLAAARAELAAATRLGADAVLVTPPFYYPTDQATVLAFYRQLAAGARIPILVDNSPQFTKVVAEPSTVATLAREGTIAGIKDSSRDFEYFENMRAATRDIPTFLVYTGSDTMLLASMVMGGTGTICGAANVAPAWVVGVYDEVQRGDLESARRHQDELIALVAALRQPVFPAAIKAALHLQGVCEPWLAPPTAALDEAAMARLRAQLDGWGLLSKPPD